MRLAPSRKRSSVTGSGRCASTAIRAIIGRTMTINQTEYVVVGVAPEEFRGHIGGLNDGYYSALAAALAPSAPDRKRTAAPGARNGVGPQSSRACPTARRVRAGGRDRAVGGCGARRRVIPRPPSDKTGGVEPYFPPGARLRSQVSRRAADAVRAVAGIVLLVVGLNISGMMLVRSAMRQRELAVRLAMGASRWRLVRYHLSEALVLAMLGGVLASALLFGGPIVVAWALEHVGTGARSLQARSVAGAAVRRVVLRHQPGAGHAAGAALQPAGDHLGAQERLGGQRPARRPPAAFHRGGAGRPRRAVPRDLRRLSRSGARDDLRGRRVHAEGTVCRAPGPAARSRRQTRSSGCSCGPCCRTWRRRRASLR